MTDSNNKDYILGTERAELLRLGLQHEAAWGSVQAHLRHDDVSDFGRANSGLLGGTWRFAPRWGQARAGSSRSC